MHQPALTCDKLLWAYRQGLFPMAESRDGEIHWYYADPRAVLPLDGRFHVSRSLRKRVRQGTYRTTRDAAFDRVIRACAEPRPYARETWISRRIIDLYCQLHRRGDAHSVEAWRGDDLVGGLYGVAIGGAFFGESMFSHATDASKVCLVHLVEHLRARGYTLLDTQFANDHMRQFGLIEIPHEQYLQRLALAVDQAVSW